MRSTTSKSPTEWWNLLRDLKSNAKWDDPDQYVKLDDLTTFVRTLYNDPNLILDSQSNPHLAFSCTNHFDANPPHQIHATFPLRKTLPQQKYSPTSKNLMVKPLALTTNVKMCWPQMPHLPNKLIQPPIPNFPIPHLHKKGSKHDPANYHPISITSCFGKLFTGILNSRLMLFMADANIAHPFQGAFTKGRRGTDHIFVANTLIDQAKQMGHPLYAAFIDLQKAYDSVSRPLPFRKLVLSGLGPKFCNLV